MQISSYDTQKREENVVGKREGRRKEGEWIMDKGEGRSKKDRGSREGHWPFDGPYSERSAVTRRNERKK
jgi:hypothetical protein